MKSLLVQILTFLTMLGLCMSCEEIDRNSRVITGFATDISCCQAVLAGQLDYPKEIPDDLSFGILYSSTPDVSIDTATKLEAQSCGTDGNFAVTTEWLEPDTQYYFRSYMLLGKKIVYAGLNNFKTLPVSTMIRLQDATAIDEHKATLNAELDLTNCKYRTFEYGFRLFPQLSVEHLYSVDNLSNGAFSCEAGSLISGQMYYVLAWVSLDGRLYASDRGTFVTHLENKPEAVDMGLSVKWASFNVGAEKPEELGDNYAWGELSVKPKYEWDTYIFYGKTPGASVFDITNKYCREDQKTVLENIDDVASVKLGGSWRMPTVDEWDELLNKDNCSWTWTTQNDANGYLVSSNTTGNTIFLRGDRHYWSSTCHPSNYQSAYALKINQSQRSLRVFYRYYGYAVRPVCD